MAEPNITYQGQREAPFLEDYRRRLLESSFKKADVPTTTPGRDIADLDLFEKAGFNFGAGQLGIDPTTGQQTGQASFQPFIDKADQYTQTGMGTIGQGIAPLISAQQQFDPSTANTAGFMNDYQKNVTDAALKQMNEQFAKQQSNLASQAQQVGAFGGSRMGVAEAELGKGLADVASQRIFQDLAQNFQQAQGQALNTFEQARQREMGAAGQFGALGSAQANLGGQQANLGAQQFGLGQQGLGQILNLGQIRRQREQALDDESFRFSTEQNKEPFQRLGFLSDVLSRTPSIQSSLTQQQAPYTNPLLGAIGAGITGLQAYGGLTGQ
jgi:hypothetical protein